MVKQKYLTRHTEPLSFPEWNVAVGDNQVNRCLSFKICALEIGCLIFTTVSSSLSHSLPSSKSMSREHPVPLLQQRQEQPRQQEELPCPGSSVFGPF